MKYPGQYTVELFLRADGLDQGVHNLNCSVP